MDASDYSSWWQLHLRFARGETLSAEEQSRYEAIRDELDRDDELPLLANAKHARTDLRQLEAERDELERQRQQLDSRIASLEDRLSGQARQLLGVGE
ncbi:MAG: hypothetical protein IAG10_16185 [Planctomycetaceae bacterium]|nr:hypothetical protein [Planctomycetaceae bacterium]